MQQNIPKKIIRRIYRRSTEAQKEKYNRFVPISNNLSWQLIDRWIEISFLLSVLWKIYFNKHIVHIYSTQNPRKWIPISNRLHLINIIIVTTLYFYIIASHLLPQLKKKRNELTNRPMCLLWYEFMYILHLFALSFGNLEKKHHLIPPRLFILHNHGSPFSVKWNEEELKLQNVHYILSTMHASATFIFWLATNLSSPVVHNFLL